jgi:hypothetical protein
MVDVAGVSERARRLDEQFTSLGVDRDHRAVILGTLAAVGVCAGFIGIARDLKLIPTTAEQDQSPSRVQACDDHLHLLDLLDHPDKLRHAPRRRQSVKNYNRTKHGFQTSLIEPRGVAGIDRAEGNEYSSDTDGETPSCLTRAVHPQCPWTTPPYASLIQGPPNCGLRPPGQLAKLAQRSTGVVLPRDERQEPRSLLGRLLDAVRVHKLRQHLVRLPAGVDHLTTSMLHAGRRPQPSSA